MVRHPRVLCALLAATVAAGCSTTPPPPPEEIRKQALDAVDIDHPWKAGVASTEAVQDNWLQSFQDPALDAIVREAVARNSDLRVAAARVEQAGQYLVIAQAALKPWIGISGTGGMKSGGGGDPSSALQGIVAAASWELDLWGRVRYSRNAARESYQSAQGDFEFARQSIAASTAKAWFTATQLSLHTRIAEQMVASARQLHAFAQDRERVGIGTDADAATALASVHTYEDALRNTKFSRDQALRALEVLLGRYPAAEVIVRSDLNPLPGPVLVGIPIQLLERRPDLVAAERRVAAAFNRVGEAKAARLPKISLNLNFGAFESEILQLKEDFENPSGGLGGRLVSPIYQGGALTAQVQIRTLEQKEAVADYARAALRALGDVENPIAANQALADRISLLTQAFNEQVRALELTQTRFKVGRSDMRAIEQQRLNTYATQTALLNVRAESLAQRVNLHLALGGSFETPSP